MTDSQRLLTDYVNDASEDAFQELVARYLDLVYSTAVRLVDGDAHRAQDVTQTVFIDLARLARGLSGEVKLGGWLHRHTCFVAAKTMRSERRRQFREQQAVEMKPLTSPSETHLSHVAPVLDEAINQLGATDRTAVLLRFYEHLDFRSIGEALGTNEAAAQKRVSRALEKLHILLKRHGITFSVAVLGVVLAEEAVTAAPAGLAASISGTALASAAAGSGATVAFFKFMAATKLKSGIIAAIIIASVVMPMLLQYQAQARLREQDGVMRQRTNQLAQVTADIQRLTALLARSNNSATNPEPGLHDLLRLRSEVGRLKTSVQEMNQTTAMSAQSPQERLASIRKMYAARVDRLKHWLEEHPSENIPELKSISNGVFLISNGVWLNSVVQLESDDDLAKCAASLRNNVQLIVLGNFFKPALQKYANTNNGRFPADLSELMPYFDSPIDTAILQRYEILPANKLVGLLPACGDMVITQKSPVNANMDLRMAVDLNQMYSCPPPGINRSVWD